MKFKTCSHPNYYDLVEVPHGHIPAPKVKLWKYIPIPVGKPRGEDFFRCWTCGAPSFFRTYNCVYCTRYYEEGLMGYERYRKNEKRKSRWKNIEYALLPLLVLLGQVKYNQSTRSRSFFDRT